MKGAALYKLALLFLVLFLQTNICLAQRSMQSFLGAASQDPLMGVYSDQISYLTKNPYRLLPVRQLEFRLQNNEFYAGEYDYGLRLSPANPWEIRNTSRYFKTYQSNLALERELMLKQVLAKRYELVVELLFLSNMHNLKEQQLENINYQLSVLEQQSGSDFFEEDDFVELAIDQFEQETELENLAFELARKIAEINTIYNIDGSEIATWSYSTVLAPDKLEQSIDSLMQLPLYTTRLAFRKERIVLADREFALERSNINPGFIQSEYMPYRKTRNPYGISLGITLPIFNPNRGDMAEKRLEIMEANNDLALEELQAKEEVDQLYASLKSRLQRYRNLEKSLSSNRLEEMSEAVSTINSNNPLIRLKLTGRQLKLQRLRAELLNDIYEDYIELLTASDLLVQRPLVNYLSPGLQPL
ncbi:hypothetical protein D770_26610 [Flammeovirgaceae bacterium 311]|nr:hypothetical protein D770_26610 [Flammeovirgaceae bacterium 311]